MLSHRRNRAEVSAWRGSPVYWQQLELPVPPEMPRQ
jgi:hypothetical protein